MSCAQHVSTTGRDFFFRLCFSNRSGFSFFQIWVFWIVPGWKLASIKTNYSNYFYYIQFYYINIKTVACGRQSRCLTFLLPVCLSHFISLSQSSDQIIAVQHDRWCHSGGGRKLSSEGSRPRRLPGSGMYQRRSVYCGHVQYKGNTSRVVKKQ